MLVVNKVGILPIYQRADGELEFLIHRPKPKKDKNKVLAFGLVRGTLKFSIEGGKFRDVRDITKLEGKSFERESLSKALLREAKEEAGLTKDNIASISDVGEIVYKDYPIHFFKVFIKDKAKMQTPVDADEVRWVTYKEALKMKELRKGYKVILKKLILP